MIGTDTAKDVVHQRLVSTITSDTQFAPGLIHWPNNAPYGDLFTEEYFTHLTNEERITKVDRGKRKVVWDAKGKRNEPWDLKVYNLAMIRLLQARFRLNLATLVLPQDENDKDDESPNTKQTNTSSNRKTRVIPKHRQKPKET